MRNYSKGIPKSRMPEPQLVLLRSLQSGISLSSSSRGILPPNISKISQRQDKTDANSSNIDCVACGVQGCILFEVRESSNERAAVAQRDNKSKASRFDVIWCQVVAQPGQDERRTRKHSRRDEERAAVPHTGSLGCQLHDVADCSEGETNCDKRAAHLYPVTHPTRNQDDKEGDEVRGDREQLCCDAIVSETRNDGREEERVGIDRHQDEEEVDAHQDRVDVDNGHADLYDVSKNAWKTLCNEIELTAAQLNFSSSTSSVCAAPSP
jgi:hypothetical protein